MDNSKTENEAASPYRDPAPEPTCAYHRCTKTLPGKPEKFGSPSPSVLFCSWGCWNGHETRKVLHAVNRAMGVASPSPEVRS